MRLQGYNLYPQSFSFLIYTIRPFLSVTKVILYNIYEYFVDSDVSTKKMVLLFTTPCFNLRGTDIKTMTKNPTKYDPYLPGTHLAVDRQDNTETSMWPVVGLVCPGGGE